MNFNINILIYFSVFNRFQEENFQADVSNLQLYL